MPDRGGVVSVIIKARDIASSKIGRFRRNLSAISRTAKDVTRAILMWTAAMAAAIVGLEKLAERGSKIIAVKRTFAKTTENETEALENLRKAAAGTIADFDLMALQNTAIALGSAKTTEEFAKQVDITRILARAQGITATEGLQKFTVGMARLSKLRLDDLGITLTQAEADERYAAILGKSASELDENEKKIAFRNEAMRQAELLVVKLGTGELKGAEAADRFGTAMKNLRDRFAETAAQSPLLTKMFDSFTTFATDLVDIIGGETDTVAQGMNAIGRMLGNALALGFNQALSASLVGPGPFFAAFRALAQDNIKIAEEGLRANREALASLARLAKAEVEVRARRRKEDEAGGGAGGGLGGGEGGAPGMAVAFPGFAGSVRELRALVDRIRTVRAELQDARLEAALAPTEEAAIKAREEVEKLEQAFASLEALAVRFGGEGVAALRFQAIPALTGALGRQTRPRFEAFRTAQVSLSEGAQAQMLSPAEARERLEQMEAATDAMKTAQAVTVSAMFGMAQAAVRGSDQVARSVISMVTQILRTLTDNTLLGAVIGGVGGLLGAAFGRRDAIPVRVDNYGSRALDQMREVGGGPTKIITIIEQGGIEIERIERELIDRQSRDEVVRFGSVTGMGS